MSSGVNSVNLAISSADSGESGDWPLAGSLVSGSSVPGSTSSRTVLSKVERLMLKASVRVISATGSTLKVPKRIQRMPWAATERMSAVMTQKETRELARRRFMPGRCQW